MISHQKMACRSHAIDFGVSNQNPRISNLFHDFNFVSFLPLTFSEFTWSIIKCILENRRKIR